ncbi:hypothetical protein EI165_14620 [Pseudoalteromonas nigrifaciens]|uniref:hypothetical protein n=1 Tax=Pseudoalteromonas nigrifaciens TaxID=28109 RepID=UPI001787DA37|nr:hypothetical protein [Pseudoalteromonas nigrifaciens]MBE0421347.1 hypothetical protein [Pseudoalteromonas nigrifaciens]
MKAMDVYPIWYQKNRPFAKQVGSIVSAKGFTSAALEQVQGKVISKWNEALSKGVVEADNATTDYLKEISLAFYHGSFCEAGKQIFAFTGGLGELLANTSAKEIPIKSIKSPYESYFIQFHLPVHWGLNEIVGAYIIDNELIPSLQVCLVLNPSDKAQHWMISPAGYFFIPLDRKQEDASLSALIEGAVNAEVVNKWQHATKSMPLPVGAEVTDKRSQRAMRESMDLNSAKVAIHKALSYVANCLCYLSSGDVESETDYPSDTSKSLLDKIKEATKPKAISKAKSQLTQHGFLPITYVGKSIGLKRSNSIHNQCDAKEHWRRGHWRNQAHGESRAERKLIWIKPTLVGQTDSVDKQKINGRVYQVN